MSHQPDIAAGSTEMTLGELQAVEAEGPELAGIDWRSLPAGTTLLVDTLNSRYRLVKLDSNAHDALVQGGASLQDGTEARIEGSTAGGSLIKSGWILKGRLLELSIGDRSLVTSPVRSIRVEAMPARGARTYSMLRAQ
jgi:hypothetical protein